MKKTLLYLGVAAMLYSCSPDSQTEDAGLNIDLTTIVNPETATASPQFDDSKLGLYKGVFVADGYHGVITVNNGNDGRYNAMLVLNNGNQIGFIQKAKTALTENDFVHFTGVDSGFSLDLSNIEDPKVVNAHIGANSANIRVLKETSANRVMATLGTFEDDSDPAFNGTWDFLSTSTTVILVPLPAPAPPGTVQAVTVNVISEVVIDRNGTMYSDTTMENFAPGAGCGSTLPPGSQAPFFSGDVTILVGGIFPVAINEFAASTQNSTYAGYDFNWSFNYSKVNGDIYYDADCNALTAGIWSSVGGRSGSILLD